MAKPSLLLLAFTGPTHYAFDRKIAAGAWEYLQQTGRARLLNAEHHAPGLNLDLVIQHNPPVNGLILHGGSPAQLERVAARGIPVVDVGAFLGEPLRPRVVADDREIGRLAADHLLSKGHRNFGYAGFPGQPYSTLRWEGFRDRLREAGHEASSITHETQRGRPADWEIIAAETARWLGTLPLPCAIFSCNDVRARMVAVEAAKLGFRIPEDFALLGVDNDTFTCELSPVPLSSIEPDCRAIGRTAARLLLDRLSGRRGDLHGPPPVLRVPPLGVVERRSTDALAIGDDQVARALRFIHEHALEPVEVEDIARAAGLGRRKLERAFRAHIGNSPYAEILRLRIEHSKSLLATTERKIAEIADACGFATASEFSVAFRKRVGQPPLAFRRKSRAAA